MQTFPIGNGQRYCVVRSWYSTVFCMRNSSPLYTSGFPLFARLIEGGRKGVGLEELD